MSSLAKTLRRWLETVCGETNSCSATSRLVRPWATRRATASSESVIAAQPFLGALARDEASADAVVTQAAAHAARVPGRAGLCVQDERGVERVDRGVDDAGAGACDAEVLERGGVRERSRPGREQLDGALEVVDVRQASSPRAWSRGRDDRRDAGVELRAPVRLRRRDLGQFVVAGGERDPDELWLVGHVDREERQDRGALILAERAQPIVRGRGIAGGHRLQGEEPGRLAAEVRRGVLEQAPCESRGSLLQASVALMQPRPVPARRCRRRRARRRSDPRSPG